jgi:hypothetical protein
VARNLGRASAQPEERWPRPRGAHAAAKTGRFRRGVPAPAPEFPAAVPQPRDAMAASDPAAENRARLSRSRRQPEPAPPAAISPPAVTSLRSARCAILARSTSTAPSTSTARSAAAALCAAAVIAVVVPLADLQIPDAIAWSLPARFAAAGPNVLASLLRAAGLALPAMAVAAPFGALAARRFRAAPVLLAGLLAIGAADALGGSARSILLVGADRTLHGLGAGISMAAVAAIVAERSRAARSLAGWWACATVCALAAAPALMRLRVTGGGWPAALQPCPWLTGTALTLAALYAILAEGTATTAVRGAFPAAERTLLALLAAPVAGMGAIAVAVTYRDSHAVVAAAVADAIALAGLAVMTVRASTAGRFAAVGAVTGFTVAPAAGTVTALLPPAELGPEVACALAAAAVCGTALALARRVGRTRPAGPTAGPAGGATDSVRMATAAGLAAAALAFGAASLAGPAVAHAWVLALLCVPLAGGLAAALTAALRDTGPGGALCGIVLLLAGVVGGYLAAGAVQLQALQGARTPAAVHAALAATATRWALMAAVVTAAVALAVVGSGAAPDRRAGGTADHG